MSKTNTIHLAAKWARQHGTHERTVAYCQRYAFTPSHCAETAEDQSKVTCTRCAKGKGFTPAAKQVSSTRGTCQCCFNQQETRQKAGDPTWRIVLHGYQRPGIGYIIGDCRGVKHVPFEVSCEETKKFRAELEQMKASREAARGKWLNDEVPSAWAQVRTGNRVEAQVRSRYTGRMTTMQVAETKPVEVKLGQGETQNPFMPDKTWEKVPSYDSLRKSAVHGLELEIKALTRHIAELTAAIENWKPVPFPREA